MNIKKASRTKSLSLSDDLPMRPGKPKNMLTIAPAITTKKIEDTGKILKYIDDSIVGKGVAFLGPFGRRKATYADYLSSGRSLQFFEDYVNKEVLPALGDPACASSVTGLQSQLYSTEAREIIASVVNASEKDQIIICESNHSSLSSHFCHLVCGKNAINKSWKFDIAMKQTNPVLFVSTSEPSKNLIAWGNAGAQIVEISKTREGFLDLVDLENKLSSYSDSKRLLLGLFAGASRLTGILADDVATTILLHQYGAFSIWDYSLAAPYAPVDMNPPLPGASKDILFFSTNNFIGGVQGPGVMVIKKSFISTISSKTLELDDTVGVVETIRAALALQLKYSLGAQCIAIKQEKLCKQILAHIRTIPEIVLLGPSQTTAKRIPNLSFLVKHPRGTFLHHRFVVAVLNDVFGIQVTATSHIGESLGINKKVAGEYENLLKTDNNAYYEHLRPGYTNLLIPFFMSDVDVAFILEAVKMVATEAWKLLPQYEFKEKTGEWRHHSNSLIKERKCLGAIRYTDGKMLFTDRRISSPGVFPQNYSDCLQTARNLFNRARKMAQKSTTLHLELKLINVTAEYLRWFMLPGEAHQLLLGHSQNVRNVVPFEPNVNKELPSFLTIFRHNSLSALDVKRFKSRSLPTSPVQIPMRRQQSSPTPSFSPQTVILMECARPLTMECITPGTVNFSLGEDVSTMATFSPPRISNLVNGADGISSRNSTCSDCAEEIQTYVAEVTKEFATEIKSEIREIISKVEDVLDNTDAVDIGSINMFPKTNMNPCDDTRSDSVSATDVAEYLKEFSKEMASEVKSEIREAVNSIPLESSNLNRKSSPPGTFLETVFEKEITGNFCKDVYLRENHEYAKFCRSVKQRYSDIENSKHSFTDDSDKNRSEYFLSQNSTPGWHLPTAPSPESSTPSCPYTGAISKLIDLNSVASQDSGINMCFPDQEETRARTLSKNFNERRKASSSQSKGNQICNIIGDGKVLQVDVSDCDSKIQKKINRTSTPISEMYTQPLSFSPFGRRHISESEPDLDLNRWQYLPKDVWEQTADVKKK